MKKACFNGCSLTVGEGFPIDSRDEYIYDRLVCHELNFYRVNIARGGSSNYEIFMRTANVLKKDFDIFFVQWSGLNRIWLYPGPDREWFLKDGCDEFRYREIYLDKKTKKQFENTLSLMNHDYPNICRLVNFCDLLDQLALYHNKILIYINGLIPWTDDLIKPLGDDLYGNLSEYTKEILDFDHRNDDEIRELFNYLQKKFQELNRSKWVNLFDSFSAHAIDTGPEGHHPGILSHKIMADKIIDYLQNQSFDR